MRQRPEITGLWNASSEESHCNLFEKIEDPCTLAMWIKELSNCIGLERLTYIAKGKRKYFIKLCTVKNKKLGKLKIARQLTAINF